MKTLLLISIMLFSHSDFCTGWKSGYIDGYCFEQGIDNCIAPPSPPCGIPQVGLNNYKGGYQQGFIRGLKDYEKNNR